jgi:signal peptidase I
MAEEERTGADDDYVAEPGDSRSAEQTGGARMDGSGSRDGAELASADLTAGTRASGDNTPDGSAPDGTAPDGTAPDRIAEAGVEPGASEPDGSAAGEAADLTADGASSVQDSTEAEPRTAARKPGASRRRRSFWRELPVLIVVALALALVIKTYALQAFYIPSGSMENTLNVGDRVLINKLVYDFRNIHRGDVVVFNGVGSWDLTQQAPSTNPVTRFFRDIGQMAGFVHGEDDFVKRVIGLPGDRVACCDAQGRVTVNGVPLSETSYLYPGNQPSTLPFSMTVPPGRLWVMGDHRDISYDSRGHMGDPGGGTIPESSVQGRVFVRIWPLSRWGFMPIPTTFQQPKLNSSTAAALDNGNIRVQAAAPGLPLLLGFAGAVPVTVLQRRLRARLRRRRQLTLRTARCAARAHHDYHL